MTSLQVVIDTNVIIAGLRSTRGTAFQGIEQFGLEAITPFEFLKELGVM